MLSILTTHPIQYQVPVWQELARRGRVDFEVWYLSDQGVRTRTDTGFGRKFQWDLDLLSGYPHRFLGDASAARVDRFRGTSPGSFRPLFRERAVTALLINGWNVESYWRAAWQAALAGIPLWLRAESNDLGRRSRTRALPRYLLLKLLFSRVSAFLCIGTRNRNLYRAFGVGSDRLFAAPYCVDNARFMQAARAAAPRRQELRASWGVPHHAVCFLFCGKLIEKKRPRDLFEAARLLLIREKDGTPLERPLHLLVVGSGRLEGELRACAAELNALAGREVVTFAGFLNQTEITMAYAAADYLVLPSDEGETWGLVVNEMMASGKPAIVSDRCGCAVDLVQPLGESYVYPCGSVADLADRMAGPLSGRPAPSDAELQATIDRFDLRHTVDTIEELYASLPAGRRG